MISWQDGRDQQSFYLWSSLDPVPPNEEAVEPGWYFRWAEKSPFYLQYDYEQS